LARKWSAEKRLRRHLWKSNQPTAQPTGKKVRKKSSSSKDPDRRRNILKAAEKRDQYLKPNRTIVPRQKETVGARGVKKIKKKKRCEENTKESKERALKGDFKYEQRPKAGTEIKK